MAKSIIFKDKETGEQLLPKTAASLVIDSEGKTVEEGLAKVAEAAASAAEAKVDAQRAVEAAEGTSTSVEEIKTAINNLPDGQAVSGQVALNTVEIAGLKDQVGIYQNMVQSPDFSDLTKWVTNAGNNISVVDGIAIINYDTRAKYHLYQDIAYVGGTIYMQSDIMNESNTTASTSPTHYLSLLDADKVEIEQVYAKQIISKSNTWIRNEYKITAADIKSLEQEKGKKASYIRFGVGYVGTGSPIGKYHLMTPMVLQGDDEDIDEIYVGAAKLTSSKSIGIKGIGKGLVASLDYKLGCLNYDYLRKRYKLSLSTNIGGTSALSLSGNVVRQVSTTGSKAIAIDDASVSVTTKDMLFYAIECELRGGNGITSISATSNLNNNTTTPLTSVVLPDDGNHIIGLVCKFGTYNTGRGNMLDNTEYNVKPCIEFNKFLVNTTELEIKRVRIYKNPGWINDGKPNDLASWILSMPEDKDNVAELSYHSERSERAKVAEEISGITPLFKGKRLITIGDSITYQNTWQPHIAAHFGMEYDYNMTGGGLGYMNINNGELYDFGLTYDDKQKCFLDSNGVRYAFKGRHGSGAANTYVRIDNNAAYTLPLTPERTSSVKYYKDSQGNKYLATNLAYGGQPMRVTGDNFTSIYEMSFFAKLYNPDVVILTGGTNDGVGSRGTADDPICELTLSECQGTITNVTVASAVKGAIKRITTDCPHALVFLAAPIRTRDNGTINKSIEELYRQIAADMGVGFINWHTNIGITDYNANVCFRDNPHPNEHGGWLMARAAIQAMLG